MGPFVSNEENECKFGSRGLYYKNIVIVNDISRTIRMTTQLGALHMIFILTTLELSFMLPESPIMLLENIYSTGVTHDNCLLRQSYFYSTGHWLEFYNIDRVSQQIYFVNTVINEIELPIKLTTC